MAINGSFAAIQTAVLGHSRAFGVIADNITNQNSPGTKRSSLSFQTIVSNFLKGPNLNQTDAHGIEPFLRQNISEQGILLSTNHAQDIALDGPGFFITQSPLNEQGDFRLTRNGNFRQFFQDGGLRDTAGSTFLADGEGDYLQGWISDASFEIPAQRDFTTLGNLNVDLLQRADPGRQTDEAFLGVNLPVSRSVTTNIPTYFVDVIDSQSTARQFVLSFQPQGTLNEWNIEVSSVETPGADPQSVGSFPLSFDSNGIINSNTVLNLATTWSDGAVSDVNLNIPELTSFGDEFFLQTFSHDGREAGDLRDYFIGTGGIVTGNYSNGAQLPLGQIAIADLVNRNQLQAVTGSKFRLSATNGDLQIYDLTQTDRARIQANALEASTIDLADSFSAIIETQHAYSLAVQSFQTIDDNLRTATNMKR